MFVAPIRAVMQEMRVAQGAIGTACSRQQDGWRNEIVRQRRALSNHIGRIATLVADPPSASGLFLPLRSALSRLRSALAEHQASWPAVSLDPSTDPYRQSVERVRTEFDAFDQALRALERQPDPTIDGARDT